MNKLIPFLILPFLVACGGSEQPITADEIDNAIEQQIQTEYNSVKGVWFCEGASDHATATYFTLDFHDPYDDAKIFYGDNTHENYRAWHFDNDGFLYIEHRYLDDFKYTVTEDTLVGENATCVRPQELQREIAAQNDFLPFQYQCSAYGDTSSWQWVMTPDGMLTDETAKVVGSWVKMSGEMLAIIPEGNPSVIGYIEPYGNKSLITLGSEYVSSWGSCGAQTQHTVHDFY